MTNKDFQKFLKWIKNRLIHKYGEKDSEVIFLFDCLINNHFFLIDHRIKDLDLTDICRKYYADYDYERDVDSVIRLGYTTDERDEIRSFITELSKDLLETYNK